MKTHGSKCESCGMPIESGAYCQYCTDDDGNLQDFEERFTRMMQWTRREDPALSEHEAEARTLTYMSSMPAWREHPSLLAKLDR